MGGKKKCLVCKSTSSILFSLPFGADQNQRRLWCDFGNVEEWKPSYRLCARHFEKEFLPPSNWTVKAIRLKPGAVPTIKENLPVMVCISSKEVTECKEPLLFSGRLPWNILQWDVQQWRAFFDSEHNDIPQTFRKGPFTCSQEPLWERKCSSVKMKMSEFFDHFSSESPVIDGWLYFDYKHIAGHLTPDMISMLDFTWEVVGFPDKGAKDSTIWIGTVGAHTPCHIDTYGCNFVAQIYGKKRWILFPPSETCNLKPVRVPYEESSIYSSYNFYRGCAQYPVVGNAVMVDLEPGDLLYVPNGWWHYVENITPAISINIWIPQESDDFSRLEECLVKYSIRSALDDMEPALAAELLNPNEDDLRTIPRRQIMEELRLCLDRIPPEKPSKASPSNSELDYLLMNYALPRTTIADIQSKQRTPHDCESFLELPLNNSLELNLVKAFSHPDVISLALEKFLELNSPSCVK